MSSSARRELARARSADYARASKKVKGAMLDEFVASTGISRRTASELLVRPPGAAIRPRGRPSKRYGADVQAALEILWAVAGHLCSKRLVPGLGNLIELMESHNESLWNEQTGAKLLKLSPATCDRLLYAKRKSFSPKGRCMTKPGTLLKHQIPIRTWSDWQDEEPGFCEMDLVHHCDNDTSGEYLHTITITDVVLGWTEVEALRNRSEKSVEAAVEAIRTRMPYPIKGLDSDCGGEFINEMMLRYCRGRGIVFTRSRPYKKNDQCKVEQKNWSVVRQNVGYDRFEGEQARRILSSFYRVLRVRVNFLEPSLKLVSKERIGGRVRKKYDEAKTPCQRALEHPCISKQTKEALKEQRETINPAHIAREILRLRSELHKYAK
jgi:hypothetical protein